MLLSEIIQRSSTHFKSPITLARKEDDNWRLCIEYHHRNHITVKNPFRIPIIEKLLDELRGAIISSKLDLSLGYHHIRVHDSDIAKTTFNTAMRHYEFKVCHSALLIPNNILIL